jgi:hypothetical protein
LHVQVGIRGGPTSTVHLRATKLAALILIACAVTACAQEPAPAAVNPASPTLTFFLARTGQQLNSSFANSFHYLEFFQVRHRWIYPDIGYVDFGHSSYREFFIGGGRTIIENKRASLDLELLYVRSFGSVSGNADYMQPFTVLRLYFTPKVTSEAEYFAYLPMNGTGHFHNVLERMKLEYAVKKPWKIGAGYAGRDILTNQWQSRPFITTTISTKAGAFEFWLQRIPSGAQVELRYRLVHASR